MNREKQVRPIGILGGTSWPSTISYYKHLNELAQTTLGGHHSADLLLRSIDYHPIKSLYGDGWEHIPPLLAKHLQELASYQPSCIVIANNTLHKAFDQIKSQLNLTVPVIHIVDAVGEEAERTGIKSALLLAVKFTMEDGFYAERLARYGVAVTIPDQPDRMTIQEIQSQLAKGADPEVFKPTFAALINKFTHLDAVILACTELPLVVTPESSKLPILDSGRAQAEKAFEVYMKQLEL
jgi:aspartate racemase